MTTRRMISSDIFCIAMQTIGVCVSAAAWLLFIVGDSSVALVFVFFFLMIRRPPRSTLDRSSAASDVYKRQVMIRMENMTLDHYSSRVRRSSGR